MPSASRPTTAWSGRSRSCCRGRWGGLGFIVTNLTLPSRAVVRFYTKRGTAEQWIKEGRTVRLTNQDRKPTSARKPSSGEASAARQSGGGGQDQHSGSTERPKRAA